mmetsp:Transcript_26006/g.58835  ORF Transcript_26006/g.58835 Transcript_26006/m.58835 type:complete len:998 (-) Transcript_26006:65-3058(-)
MSRQRKKKKDGRPDWSRFLVDDTKLPPSSKPSLKGEVRWKKDAQLADNIFRVAASSGFTPMLELAAPATAALAALSENSFRGAVEEMLKIARTAASLSARIDAWDALAQLTKTDDGLREFLRCGGMKDVYEAPGCEPCRIGTQSSSDVVLAASQLALQVTRQTLRGRASLRVKISDVNGLSRFLYIKTKASKHAAHALLLLARRTAEDGAKLEETCIDKIVEPFNMKDDEDKTRTSMQHKAVMLHTQLSEMISLRFILFDWFNFVFLFHESDHPPRGIPARTIAIKNTFNKSLMRAINILASREGEDEDEDEDTAAATCLEDDKEMDPDVSDIMSDSDESSTELSHLNWASHLRDDKTIAGDVQEVFVKFFKGGGARKVTTTTLQEVEDEIARFSADDLPSLKKFLQRRREKRNSRPAHVELDESLPSHRRALLSCDPPDKLRSKKTSSGKVLKMEEDLPGLNLCEDTLCVYLHTIQQLFKVNSVSLNCSGLYDGLCTLLITREGKEVAGSDVEVVKVLEMFDESTRNHIFDSTSNQLVLSRRMKFLFLALPRIFQISTHLFQRSSASSLSSSSSSFLLTSHPPHPSSSLSVDQTRACSQDCKCDLCSLAVLLHLLRRPLMLHSRFRVKLTSLGFVRILQSLLLLRGRDQLKTSAIRCIYEICNDSACYALFAVYEGKITVLIAQMEKFCKEVKRPQELDEKKWKMLQVILLIKAISAAVFNYSQAKQFLTCNGFKILRNFVKMIRVTNFSSNFSLSYYSVRLLLFSLHIVASVSQHATRLQDDELHPLSDNLDSIIDILQTAEDVQREQLDSGYLSKSSMDLCCAVDSIVLFLLRVPAASQQLLARRLHRLRELDWEWVKSREVPSFSSLRVWMQEGSTTGDGDPSYRRAVRFMSNTLAPPYIRFLFAQIDRDATGDFDAMELMRPLHELFQIGENELEKNFQAMADPGVMAVKPGEFVQWWMCTRNTQAISQTSSKDLARMSHLVRKFFGLSLSP